MGQWVPPSYVESIDPNALVRGMAEGRVELIHLARIPFTSTLMFSTKSPSVSLLILLISIGAGTVIGIFLSRRLIRS